MIPSLYEVGYVVSYTEGDVSLQRTPIPFYGTVGNKYHVVSDGDSLQSLAQKYYGDQFQWYIIADANPTLVDDPFSLEVNTTLLIPEKDIITLIYD